MASTVQFGGESYDILARRPIEDRDNLDDLDDFTVTLADGQQVPLRPVATVDSGRGFAKITRIAGERTVTVEANVDGRKGNAQAMVADMQESFLPGMGKSKLARPNIPEAPVHPEYSHALTVARSTSAQRGYS